MRTSIHAISTKYTVPRRLARACRPPQLRELALRVMEGQKHARLHPSMKFPSSLGTSRRRPSLFAPYHHPYARSIPLALARRYGNGGPRTSRKE